MRLKMDYGLLVSPLKTSFRIPSPSIVRGVCKKKNAMIQSTAATSLIYVILAVLSIAFVVGEATQAPDFYRVQFNTDIDKSVPICD